MKQQTKRRISLIGTGLFILYLIALVYFLFFAEEYGRTQSGDSLRYNFIPFREIGRFIRYRHILGMEAVLLNIAGNIAIFLPFGAIVPVMHGSMRKGGRTIGLCMMFSLGVEVLQLFTRVGSFDVDDIMLNTLGGALGYAVFGLSNALRRKWYG